MKTGMKIRLLQLSLTLAVASIVAPALNADEPTPKRNGIVEIETLPRFQVLPAGKKPQAAPRLFLGIVLGEVPDIVREQLGLPEGVGIAIQSVMKDSPAAKAGMKPHDILLKLEDQQLVNDEQLQTLVGNKKEGDSVTLTLLRQGKEQKVAVKLEKGRGDLRAGEGLGNLNPLRVRPDVRGFQGGFVIPPNLPFEGLQEFNPKELLKRFQINPNIEIPPQALPNGQGFRFNVQSQNNSMSSMSDESGKYTYSNRNGKKHFKAEDKQGNTLFDGDVDTDEQRKGIPDGIRPKLETLEKSVNFNQRVVPNNPPIEKKIEPKKKAPTGDERA